MCTICFKTNGFWHADDYICSYDFKSSIITYDMKLSITGSTLSNHKRVETMQIYSIVKRTCTPSITRMQSRGLSTSKITTT